ncbi:hypothetical protein EJ110_NYTH30471 [Nymphaea thermarum]|nr:hypothetical protein EJ110_NYTH30471 [Nymphaea thermarum]
MQDHVNMENTPDEISCFESSPQNKSPLQLPKPDSICKSRKEKLIFKCALALSRPRLSQLCNGIQLASASMDYDPLYDADKGATVMPSSFHDISDVEFQDNWGRVWVDLGTSDYFAIDVLLNCFTVLSSEYLGIQQVVFGGQKIGDWEEGMTDPDYGYKYFKI